MLNRLTNLIRACCSSHVMRYLFFGGLTTVVNLAGYAFLRVPLRNHLVIANSISVAIAILFAYFVNARFVFASAADTFTAKLKECLTFVSARISTMVIEVGGVWLMSSVLRLNDMLAKLVIQLVVMALNYVFSRFLVFRRPKTAKDD